MNSRDKQIARLMKSARHAPAPPEPRLSWAAEMNVLAEWRKARASGDMFDWLPLLHKAVAVACVIVVISAVASMSLKPTAPQPDELSSLNEVVNAAANWL
jgi:hypothetical protein